MDAADTMSENEDSSSSQSSSHVFLNTKKKNAPRLLMEVLNKITDMFHIISN